MALVDNILISIFTHPNRLIAPAAALLIMMMLMMTMTMKIDDMD